MGYFSHISFNFKILALFSAILLAYPSISSADDGCGPAVAGADSCESQTWSRWLPWTVMNCTSAVCPRNDRGVPRCYPFWDGTCKCAGKNPLRKADGASFAPGVDIESEEGILRNFFEHWVEEYGAELTSQP